MDKNTLSNLTAKGKEAFLKRLHERPAGMGIREGDAFYNEFLDCFFRWTKGKLVRYVNESMLKPEGQPMTLGDENKGE